MQQSVHTSQVDERSVRLKGSHGSDDHISDLVVLFEARCDGSPVGHDQSLVFHVDLQELYGYSLANHFFFIDVGRHLRERKEALESINLNEKTTSVVRQNLAIQGHIKLGHLSDTGPSCGDEHFLDGKLHFRRHRRRPRHGELAFETREKNVLSLHIVHGDFMFGEVREGLRSYIYVCSAFVVEGDHSSRYRGSSIESRQLILLKEGFKVLVERHKVFLWHHEFFIVDDLSDLVVNRHIDRLVRRRSEARPNIVKLPLPMNLHRRPKLSRSLHPTSGCDHAHRGSERHLRCAGDRRT
mmetsp:Transcript_11523/g.21134  ORF Transcript_11523/g.21134 Transcript_11523/m.21134 type:complete len:297 (-) Transcript_11523:207-1097(-)